MSVCRWGILSVCLAVFGCLTQPELKCQVGSQQTTHTQLTDTTVQPRQRRWVLPAQNNADQRTQANSSYLLTLLPIMPHRIPGAIPWRNSAARKILLGDLERAITPLYESELTAEDAWARVYKHLVEFEQVPFQQFQVQLQAHREQVLRRVKKAADNNMQYRNFCKEVPNPKPSVDWQLTCFYKRMY